MKKVNIKNITHLNRESLRGLEFYKLEIKFLQERLDEIANDNNSTEVRQHIEHFQNQLLIHSNVIDELSTTINVNTRNIELQITEKEPFVDEALAQEHQKLYADYQTEEKIINELRHEFNRFAEEWM